MLVVTRKVDERIVIGEGVDRIEVVICDVRGHGSDTRVKVGVVAPRAVKVFREEVFREIERERELERSKEDFDNA